MYVRNAFLLLIREQGYEGWIWTEIGRVGMNRDRKEWIWTGIEKGGFGQG
jgi:hypothetical protein